MLLAVVVMTAMYIGLCFSIAEMSPALPHAGGAYSFARTSMGPWGGYITGLAENMEYILTPAVIVVGIGGYLGAIFGTPNRWEPVWWLVCYGVFVALNVWGVEMTFHVSVVVTLIALAVLASSGWAPCRISTCTAWASPYFAAGGSKGYSAIVELPVRAVALSRDRAAAAGRRREPRPEARHAARHPLRPAHAHRCLVSHRRLECRHRSRRGQDRDFQRAAVPRLPNHLRAGLKTRVLALSACTGLIASFHTIIFAYGRQIYSLSRAGYFPTWLSVTHGTSRRRRTARCSPAPHSASRRRWRFT